MRLPMHSATEHCFSACAGAAPGIAVQMYGQPAQWGLMQQRQLLATALQQQQYLSSAGAQQQAQQQQLQQFGAGGGMAAEQLLHFNGNPRFGNGLMQ